MLRIVGIKSAEVSDRSEWVWKGRIVFGGDQVRTGEGDWAVFEEVGSIPTTMTASRILLACKMLDPNLMICQSDCISAYVQATLPEGDVTYCSLPRQWWPKRWFNADGTCKYLNPVVRMVKALYGHPRAGDLWADKLGGVLR